MTDSSTNKSTSKHVAYFSRLKALACLAVVILHTFYAADAFAVSSGQHMLAISIRNLMMWSVPCFVMVTGALLFDPKRNVTIGKIFKKYLPRVVLALVFFSFAFAIFDAILLKRPIGGAFATGFNAIVYGTGWKHMWYLYLIIGIYLVLPFYRMVTRSATDTEIKYLLAVLFVFQAVIPVCQSILNVTLPFYIPFFTIYPLFLLAGYAIHNDILKIKMWVSILFVAVGVASVLGMTYLSVYKGNAAANAMVTAYSFPGIVLFSLGVFAIYKECGKKPCKSDVFMTIIDKNSFGIYLMHMAVLKVFAIKVRPAIFVNPAWMIIEILAAFIIPFIMVSAYYFICKVLCKGVKACRR